MSGTEIEKFPNLPNGITREAYRRLGERYGFERKTLVRRLKEILDLLQKGHGVEYLNTSLPRGPRINRDPRRIFDIAYTADCQCAPVKIRVLTDSMAKFIITVLPPDFRGVQRAKEIQAQREASAQRQREIKEEKGATKRGFFKAIEEDTETEPYSELAEQFDDEPTFVKVPRKSTPPARVSRKLATGDFRPVA